MRSYAPHWQLHVTSHLTALKSIHPHEHLSPDELSCSYVDLTSRPERTAANRLYSRAGFVKRETNVYRYTCA
jgi:ribosomal protein S18 acetylase RimI-like enzyme